MGSSIDREQIARQFGLTAEALDELEALLVGDEPGADPLTVSLRSALGAVSADSELMAISLPTFSERSTLKTQPSQTLPLPPRYELLGVLGMGGMGEVYRVWDRELNRSAAMKVVREDLHERPSLLARFVEEAQIGAQLQHPGIVPVYEVGLLEDGRLYFTMLEIHGQTFSSLIREVQKASTNHTWGLSPDGWSFRRLMLAFLRACEAVAYAHEHGVIHRDLKPSNIMVGAAGQVYVVDWGLAKVLRTVPNRRQDTDKIVTSRSGSDVFSTQVGGVAGTPAYMAPEQAIGEPHRLDARADVFALGGILLNIFTGRPPREDSSTGSGAIPEMLNTDARAWLAPVPEALESICLRALDPDPSLRHPHAGALAEEVLAWEEGAARKERAAEWMREASELEALAETLILRSRDMAKAAKSQLATIPPWASEDEKVESWAMLEDVRKLEARAALRTLEANQRLHGALLQAPDWPDVRARLAEHHAHSLQAAEARSDVEASRSHAFHLREHTDALPEGHPTRSRMRALLRGDGALTLVTEPPGAEVQLYRYTQKRRRLEPQYVRSLGATPLVEIPLEAGSYLLKLQAEGCAEVRYPVTLGRQEHWDGVRPGDTEPYPIVLPAKGELGEEDVYVPAGWFWAGGDTDEDASLPRCRVWADAFVIKRTHVTHRAYLGFLNDLVRQGRSGEADQHVPRERSVLDPLALQEALYFKDPETGLFAMPDESPIGIWSEERPVLMVNWFSAVAFGTWLSESTGQGWRLPADLEWEKAARGVDGRIYPWGNASDPSWARIAGSQEGFRKPTDVGSYPIDESPYGMRDAAGNAIDWCLDSFVPNVAPEPVVEIPRVDVRRVSLQEERCNRGGCWVTDAPFARLPRRSGHVPFVTSVVIGFRLARSADFAHKGDA